MVGTRLRKAMLEGCTPPDKDPFDVFDFLMDVSAGAVIGTFTAWGVYTFATKKNYLGN